MQVTQEHLSALDECAEYLVAARTVLEVEQLDLPGIHKIHAQISNAHAFLSQLREKARMWARLERSKAAARG